MKIAIVDTLGLCYDGSTLDKRGLGGSESAVISISRELAKLGFSVKVFNDCASDDTQPGVYNNVEYIPLADIEKHNDGFDIFIGSRSVVSFAPNDLKGRFKWAEKLPNLELISQNSKHKVLWMHDTFCDGDDLIEDLVLQGRINEIFTLSDWHTTYVTNCNHGKRRNFEVLKRHVFQTRNGINLYNDWVDVKQKDPDLFVYNASVTKGMIPLVEKIWPQVKQQLPNAKLTVIGGYYRFRSDHGPDEQELKFRELEKLSSELDITFTGIIKQNEIADILAQSSFMIYPAAFPETFGISSLESLAYNTPLITCTFGALEETAIDLACYKIPYAIEPNSLFPTINTEYQIAVFVNTVVQAYHNRYLHQQKQYACNQIKDVCSWSTVALQWKQHFYKLLGDFLPVEEYREVKKINARVKKVFGRRFTNTEETYEVQQAQKKINVIVPVYNAESYISNCIKSIAAQDYDNYHVYIINDASTDNTQDVIMRTVLKLNQKHKFTMLLNEYNKGAVCNQISTIKNYCESDSIIMLVDGDDWLANNSNIFHMYNNLFADGAQYTYGSCWSLADNIPLIAQPYPPEVKQAKNYKNYKFNWNMPYPHLRTFLSDLVLELDDDLFKDSNGEWYGPGGDNATFYNIIEQADPDSVVCVPDVVYMYNDTNPLNDYKINGEEQNKTANKIIKGNDVKKKILIGIPTAKYIEVETFKSIYDLEVPDGYEVTFQYFYGYQIDQVRNLIADWVVKGFDYLFSVDSDVIFASDTLKKLLLHDVDMVCGIYRQRLPNQTLEIYDQNFRNIPAEILPQNQLVEIGGCGFGCVLVKRAVFENIGYPQFEYHSALDHRNTFSEDNDFCKKARSKGHRIFCDTSIVCGHKGTHIYNVELPKEVQAKDPVLERFKTLSDQALLPKQHVDFLHQISSAIHPKVIYDLGACVLHWTSQAKAVWPTSEFVLFEAMSEVEPLYKEKNIKHYHLGVLSDTDGKPVDFYQNLEHPGGNSYYKENPDLSPLANELFPENNKVRKISRTLDSVVKEKNFPLPDLIKMDVQGAEMDILKGAQETIANCKYIILELQHVDYNFGAPKVQEVINYMSDLGYKNIPEGAFCGSELGVDGDYFFVKD